MPRPITPGERHTYDGWTAIGYQVQRGERSVARNNYGQALFEASQVRPRGANARPPAPGEYRQPPARRARNQAPRVTENRAEQTFTISYGDEQVSQTTLEQVLDAVEHRVVSHDWRNYSRDLQRRNTQQFFTAAASDMERQRLVAEEQREFERNLQRVEAMTARRIEQERQAAPQVRRTILSDPLDEAVREARRRERDLERQANERVYRQALQEGVWDPPPVGPVVQRGLARYVPQDDEPTGFQRFNQKAKAIKEK